jgi:hypothetical protein
VSTAQASPVPPRSSTLLPETPDAGGGPGARGSVAAGRIGAATLAAVAPPTAWFTESIAGAAASPWLVASAVSGKGTGAGYSTAKATGEWAFLSDPSLSLEDKLSRFMIAVQKKLGDELTEKMDEYRARYGEGGADGKKEEPGFLGSILGAIFPSGGLFDKVFAGLEKLLGEALKSLGGPLLAALTSAVGLPMLAPAALKVGASLGSAVAGSLSGGKAKASSGTKTTKSTGAKPGGAGSTSTKSGSTKKGEAGSPDERLDMLEIQRLVEKQNQLFTLVSNLMKSMHDTSMVAIQNVR